MKALLYLVFFSFIVLSCSKAETKDVGELQKGDYSYFFFKNKQLSSFKRDGSYLKIGQIKEGQNLVFKYQFDADDVKEIADDEYSEIIWFQVPSNVDSFQYQNQELENIEAVFSKICFCFFQTEAHKDVAPTGIIKGQKLSATEWLVNFDVTFYGDERKTFNKKFKLKVD